MKNVENYVLNVTVCPFRFVVNATEKKSATVSVDID